MFKVKAGISLGNSFTHEFPVLVEAMDFADFLHASGFYYAEVFDEDRELQYYVVDQAPRTSDERHERQNMAKDFIRKWPAKVAQDYAYSTYEQNIRWSRDLDAILASAPGYLKRSIRV